MFAAAADHVIVFHMANAYEQDGKVVIDASGESTSDRTNLEAVVAPAEVEAVGTLDIEVVATASRG